MTGFINSNVYNSAFGNTKIVCHYSLYKLPGLTSVCLLFSPHS